MSKLRYILLLSVLILISVFFQSCNEQPTGLGYFLLNDTISIKSACSDDTPLIVSTESIEDPTVIFNSSCVYIGRTDSLKAIAMVRFQYIPDSLTYLTTDKISECYMELYPNEYAIGDTIGNNLSFNVYRVKKYWTAKTVCDSLFDETGNSDYFDVVSQGSYSKPIPYGDTVGPIRIDLNKQMLLDWFVMARDSVINWGIAMISDENTNVIRQFSAQAITEDLKGAELTMYYTNDKGERDTLKLTAGIEASVVCIKQPATDNMVIQGGIINKGKMALDLSEIPAEAGILSAELELTINQGLVKKGNMPLDSLLRLSLYYDDNYDSTQKKILVGYRESGTDVFKFPNLVEIVEGFLRNNNGKGNIYFEPEGWSIVQRLDRMPFYGINEENVALRPKLRIIYSARFSKRN